MHGIGSVGIEGYIESCYNLGTITENYTGAGGTVGIGGILGYNYKGNIKNCYNIGEINTSRNSSVGSIVGSSSSESIINCYYQESSLFQGLGEVVTSDEMKGNDFVSKINGESGTSFIYDNDNINKGYPILYWQKDKIDVDNTEVSNDDETKQEDIDKKDEANSDDISKEDVSKIQEQTNLNEQSKNTEDNTIATGTLPQTGVNIIFPIISFIAIILVAVILYKKYNNYKGIK